VTLIFKEELVPKKVKKFDEEGKYFCTHGTVSKTS
jgi:hypothetical protein